MSVPAAPDLPAIAREVGAGGVLAIEPIKHGLTNRSWLLHTSGGKLVVRSSNALEGPLQIDRASEAVVLGEVARAGIGPRVLLNDPGRGILVTRYLGNTWTAEDAHHPRNIERLAGVLRRVHALAIPLGVREVNLHSVMQTYLRTLDERGSGSRLTRQSLREYASDVAKDLRRHCVLHLCHNDVHHLNIIGAEELRLIDWEYAGAGESLFDLASACVYHGYGKDGRERLLRAYAQSEPACTMQRLELACWLFDYIRDLWTAVLEMERPPP